MASASVDAAAGATAANDAPAPRKYKASDLPLPSATRAAIDSLAHSFKKKGGYDAIRKEVWDKFAASDYEEQVTKAILEVAEHEVQRNPHQLLTLDRGKAAALIDGALERSGVYQKAEQVITQLIDKKAIEERMRQLRRADIGEEEATAEQQRGAKTDEEYHADTMGRRAERERVREELRQKELAIEEEKRKIAREERKKVEKEREKAEEQRKAERDARRAAREKAQAERDAERDERRRQRDRERSRDRNRDRSRSRSRRRDRDRDRERDRERDAERERERQEERERRRKQREEETEKAKKNLTQEDMKRLEEEALLDLLRESTHGAAKQPEMEIDEALAPPPRKLAPASAIMPIKKVSSRDSPKVSESKKPSDPVVKKEARDGSVAAAPKVETTETRTRSRSVVRETTTTAADVIVVPGHPAGIVLATDVTDLAPGQDLGAIGVDLGHVQRGEIGLVLLPVLELDAIGADLAHDTIVATGAVPDLALGTAAGIGAMTDGTEVALELGQSAVKGVTHALGWREGIEAVLA
ncbi:Reticulocyte-binding protein 2-like protein a [Colletotrichum siamense]|uniref:Reticulocyte-binding protein 2-like protein a n=1 Tax=Colletotrichum siamense TaxID=690259 RepID=UPI001872FC45|nr:Reticulocyte-binding protein 2-like protein a [Colletotrichum siamense]KAF5505078.1 Reticulocyte-binding protein 2-like protein a [Colletotrichum siamense]